MHDLQMPASPQQTCLGFRDSTWNSLTWLTMGFSWRGWQVLSTRARKDVQVADIKVQVLLFAFDCLYHNGEVLLQKPLTERRERLYSAISEKQGELAYAVAKVVWTPHWPAGGGF